MSTLSKAEVILHPVRMRIFQSLIKRPLTSLELMEWLPEIPQATLYRQLKVLIESEIIYICEERKVKGTFERTYAVNNEQATISPKEALQISKEDHLKYFTSFTVGLLRDVEAYLEDDKLDMEKDGFGYRQVDLYLDDEEFKRFSDEFVTILKKYSRNEPNGERRRRTLANVIVPELYND